MIQIKLSSEAEWPASRCKLIVADENTPEENSEKTAPQGLSPYQAKLYAAGKKLIIQPQEGAEQEDGFSFLHIVAHSTESAAGMEHFRRAGAKLAAEMKAMGIRDIALSSSHASPAGLLAYAEGLALGAYQFIKYKSEAENDWALESVHLTHEKLPQEEVALLRAVVSGTLCARDLINEPSNFLTAEQLSEDIKATASEAGFHAETFNKGKIESLRMGGLLAVNAGSQLPPTFNILEYRHPEAINSRPIVLVGKGVVFDTGGLSLKPTLGSMDSMKSDMSGAAAVVGTFKAVAQAGLPLYIVGLIPATDNRPGENAICPGDIITTMNGTSIEVLNTDAEGRLILADALTYAERYEPALVIDLATLTGAAARAIGQHGIVYMGTAQDEVKDALEQSGMNTWERLVEFPLWDEYGDMIKSDIADLKNVAAGGMAGASTAGKFLQHFAAEYDWLHLDIAGPAFLTAPDSYRGRNATGVGVRLLFDFLLNYADSQEKGGGK